MDDIRSPAPIPPWYRETGVGPRSEDGPPLTLPEFAPVPVARKRRDRRWINLLLLLLTVASTLVVGYFHYVGFAEGLDTPTTLWHGVWYSGTILAILGAHELGHYYACRYYRVDASLPYFLPAPFITGTLGAFIRIREPIPTKRILFDIGVAGPIAGFVVAIPALFVGISQSRLIAPSGDGGIALGEPLLFQFTAWLVWGDVADGQALLMHPMAFAAWFGLIATLLNLFPIGHLDGGHISYAVLGSRSTAVTVAGTAAVIALAFYSRSWALWAVLMVVMLALAGPRHPRTIDHHVPLNRSRLWVAVFAVFMFIVCFTPALVEISGPAVD